MTFFTNNAPGVLLAEAIVEAVSCAEMVRFVSTGSEADLYAMRVARAFQTLGGHDAVLGPAEDGGYWLVGQRRTPRTLRLFDAVRWSSAHTLADTLVPPDAQRVMAASVGADLIEIDADHGLFHEQPERLAELLVTASR